MRWRSCTNSLELVLKIPLRSLPSPRENRWDLRQGQACGTTLVAGESSLILRREVVEGLLAWDFRGKLRVKLKVG